MSKEISVIVNNVSKVYKVSNDLSFTALDNISFSVEKGEFFGILGLNGAGKSTLLKLLSNVTKPTTGEIKTYGRIVSMLEVGTGFHPEMTGYENIYLNGAIIGMTKKEIDEKLQSIIDFSEIGDFINLPVKKYSSGMYMRLAFAIAINSSADILIIDEVLAVGDAYFQEKCIKKIKEINTNGSTIIFVSHSMPLIKSMCNKCIFLKKGKIEYIGSTKDAVDRYMSVKGIKKELLKTSWDNENVPNHGGCKIYSISILNNNKIYDNSKIDFQINYEVYEKKDLCFSFILRNKDGEIILSSLSNLEKHFVNNDRRIGNFVMNLSIPPYLLQPGQYTVQINVVCGEYRNIKELNNVLVFVVHESDTILGGYEFGIQGAVRPKLIWDEQLKEDNE